MSVKIIGMIAGALVFCSIIPYAIRTYQGKIYPNITSFSLWTFIGLTLLITYKSSGAEANVWPAVSCFIRPFSITILLLLKNRNWQKPNRVEIVCLIIGFLALILWMFVCKSKELAQFALYLAILADACAAIPTIVFVWKNPAHDRPFAWTFMAIGYGLAIFSITENTFANYALPLYMIFVCLCISTPLVVFRIKYKYRLSEWI